MADYDGSIRIKAIIDDADAVKTLSGLGSKLGNIGGKIAKASAVGIGAAATAVGAVGKASVDSYAEFEQLKGGVETLFKDSSGTVMEYANNAFQTAGLSANEYMSTVTSFSASLLQGLGGDTAQAANVANTAITDMADNANKMGTSMSMIQNAYQGFAKQNYTMLDNLKLGYGGTQAEMARLINDSGVLGASFTATASNINEVSFDKIIEAIHAVQTQIGITGTTAQEAAGTIQGSTASMKAAWENLLTGMADPDQDLGPLIDNLATTMETGILNMLPRIEAALQGISDVVIRLAPVISSKLPDLINALLPGLVAAVGALITALAQALPGMLQQLASAAMQVIDIIGDSLAEKIPFLSGLFQNLETVVLTVTAALIAYKAAMAIQGVINAVTAALPLLKAAVAGQTTAWGALTAVLHANPFVSIATAVIAVTTAIVTFIATNEDLRNKIAEIWESIKTTVKNVIDDIVGFLGEAVNAVKEFFSSLTNSTSLSPTGLKGSFSATGGGSMMRSAAAPASLLDAYPHLANGAVISPNNEFLAVLGDQRSGTNIETPLDTMLQAFRQAMSESDMGGGDVIVNMNGNTTVSQFVRMLYPHIEIERKRRGTMIGGGSNA